MKSQGGVAKFLFVLGVLGFFSLSAMNGRPKADFSLKNWHHLERLEEGEDEDEGIESFEEEKRKPRPDHPDEAVRFRRLQMQDEKGFIPPDGLEKARQHIALMKARVKSAPKGLGPVEPISWDWLGPGNVGGRIRTIVVHPTDATKMWLGSVGGGIWQSTDGGDSWGTFSDFIGNLAVSTIVLHPTTPSTMYAGTGEGFYNLDAIQGAGVFKSLDGGLNWSQVASTANNNWYFVNRLAVSPDGSTILAANAPQRDANGNVIQNGGIFRTANDGASWPRSTCQGSPCTALTFDIDFHPTDSLRAIAGGEGVARFSTDGGTNWNPASFSPLINPQAPPAIAQNRRIELAYAPSSPNIVWASVNQNQTGSSSGTYRGEVYRSTDGGQSYTRVSTTDYLGGQGWYGNALWVNPQDPNFIILGGVDLWRGIFDPATQALTLTQISRWQDAPGTSAHADHHVIVAHPGFNNTTNRIAFFGNDGGIYRTNDVQTVAQSSGWLNKNRLLGITQFYSGAGNPTTGTIIGGAQDNGTLSYPAPGLFQWGVLTDTSGNGIGDGGICAADPTDSNYFYTEYIYLRIYRSSNGGISASRIDTGINDANNAATANFIAPFILDPNDPNTMLAGGVSLWRSTNVKATTPSWTAIKAPSGVSNPISAIAVSATTSDIICVGHKNGDIYLTFNGTDTPPNWARIDPPAPTLPDRFVTRLVIDNTRTPFWIYATFGGFSADNVYRSTDLGATWTNISGSGTSGLPAVPVRSLVLHPFNKNLIYVGTEMGIFTSDDAGATWDVTQGGPANVSVEDLFWMGGNLIAVTHGRGMYRASGGIYVDCNYVGNELGTYDQPFRTVSAAVNAVTTYRPVWLKPCNYNEPMTITKKLELRSLGGPAIIGRQP